MATAERRRGTLLGELAHLEDARHPAVPQLTPAALERHLEGITGKIRSGDVSWVREAISQSVERIAVGVDGKLTLEARSDSLLGVPGAIAQLWCRGDSAKGIFSLPPELTVPFEGKWAACGAQSYGF